MFQSITKPVSHSGVKAEINQNHTCHETPESAKTKAISVSLHPLLYIASLGHSFRGMRHKTRIFALLLPSLSCAEAKVPDMHSTSHKIIINPCCVWPTLHISRRAHNCIRTAPKRFSRYMKKKRPRGHLNPRGCSLGPFKGGRTGETRFSLHFDGGNIRVY
ncbi:hypothetical protein BC827DRAFT_731156 [Russula dissimulans]|nr:hypothetical protein BC827DRAFT_731156 [Russula dissimulans]